MNASGRILTDADIIKDVEGNNSLSGRGRIVGEMQVVDSHDP